MDDNNTYLAYLLLAIVALFIMPQFWPRPQPRRQRRPRAQWARQWLLRRELYGDYENLLWELHREDHKGFKTFIRITPAFFEQMIAKITPAVRKQETRLRKPIPVGLKLAVTLRFLATGNTYTSLGFSFRTSTSAISLFVPVVCKALIAAYKEDYLKCPTTPAEWNEVARTFATRWNYYNCGGALDGKHIAIRKPNLAGTQYFNYKRFHSIILMALADAQYRFLYVDIGAEGAAGDAGTWYRSNLNRAINTGRVGFPEDAELPNANYRVPFHIIADDAFALNTWLMKPYAHLSQVHTERVYSYRLSRARRVVENAFGILQMRWRVFGLTIQLQPPIVRLITMCACVLHNVILHHNPPHRHHVDREDAEHNFVPGAWREEDNLMEGLQMDQGRNPPRRAKGLRDYLAKYYASPAGCVPWQDRLIYPHGRPAHVQ